MKLIGLLLLFFSGLLLLATFVTAQSKGTKGGQGQVKVVTPPPPKDECVLLPRNNKNNDCSTKKPQGLTEESISIIYQNGQTSRYCCTPGSLKGQLEKKAVLAKKCYTTSCTKVDSPPGLCLKSRIVNGERIDYEEVLRDTCTLPGKVEGRVAQCCPTHSMEGLLLATLGAEVNEFPHKAALSFGCGGTIYNEQYVITAAHCIVDAESYLPKPVTNMKVTLGTNIGGHAGIESESHRYSVVQAIPHPDYSRLKSSKVTLEELRLRGIYNDVAVLKLDRKISFGRNVKALRIAPKGFRPMDYADHTVITGWGTTDTLALSKHLQKANLLLRGDHVCFGGGGGETKSNMGSNSKAGPWAHITKVSQLQQQYLCIGGIVEGKWSPNAYKGDSGGPAICRDADGFAVLCGISSFSGNVTACALEANSNWCRPNVYVEVEYFRDWIQNHAGSQSHLKAGDFHKAKLYGDVVPPGKYSHQAHITSSEGKSCGGTLIGKDLVITAAHCVYSPERRASLKGLKVSLGGGNSKGGSTKASSSPSTSSSSFGVKNVIPLEGFRLSTSINSLKASKTSREYTRVLMADKAYVNDVALLKLDKPVPLDESKIAKLPTGNPASASPHGIAMELSKPRATTYGAQLREREFKILERDNCQSRVGRLRPLKLDAMKDFVVKDNVLCGVETYSGGSMCDRELGGGLICKDSTGADVLCGVQTFRLCETTLPNAFIDVGKIRPWIEKHLKTGPPGGGQIKSG